MSRPKKSPKIILDRFQIEAIAAIDDGDSVLVSAPTGSGKTIVAEHALATALREGRRAFYTTPIKALSNQKFHDLVEIHGSDSVGLLTGDTSINGDASIVVMTTEVLRNMIYSGSAALDPLLWVVLDEVHYLQDTFRGSVWEEVIIHLPEHIRLVCLSATVSNAAELGEWITSVRGTTRVVTETHRPVELDNWYLVDDRSVDGLVLLPTSIEGAPNDRGSRYDIDPRDRARGIRRRSATPGRVEVVELLAERQMLPAIHFIFSRAACDDAVTSCTHANLRFTSDDERTRILEIAEHHVQDLTDEDLDVLEYDRWLDSLQRGIASHHAGMVPPFKEAVERCFVEGLVKIVFATETLALGINMPARTVVIDKLTKFTGERHESLTPAQFTQLTGRAGRRGIDDHGNAIVLWSPFVPFSEVASLVASRSFRLTSSFRPTYNMAANLVRRYDAANAHRLLGMSFAQFQVNADIVRSQRRLASRYDALTQLELQIVCEHGDAEGYRSLLERSRNKEQRHRGDVAIESALTGLRPGDVLWLEGSGGHDRVAVLSVSSRKGGSVRVKALSAKRNVIQFGSQDFDERPVIIGRIDLPVPFAPTKPSFQRDVSYALDRFVKTGGSNAFRSEPRNEEVEPNPIHTHPVHDCPERDQHLRALRDRDRISREISDLDRQISSRTGSLIDQFDRILQMLEAWGHLDGWSLTARGERLVRIYHESDLLIAEAMEEGIMNDLDAPSLAGLVSAFVYESRNSGPQLEPWFPTRQIEERANDLQALARSIASDELRLGLPPTRVPDPAFFGLAHAWSSGDDLDRLLADEEMPGGDFVRTVKQLVDLLRQMSETHADFASVASEAADSLFRGVVSVSGTARADLPPAQEAQP